MNKMKYSSIHCEVKKKIQAPHGNINGKAHGPNKTCHYLSNIVHDPEVVKDRDASFSGAGCLRTLYLARHFPGGVTIVSMGAGEKTGFFSEKHERVDDQVVIVYLPQWHLVLFKKKLRHLFYAIFLFRYLIQHVKKEDLVIVYNTYHSFFMIMPALLAKAWVGFRYLLEVEEFYSRHRQEGRLNFPEWLSVRNAAGYLLVSEGQLPLVNLNLPWILNRGYRSRPAGQVRVRTDESVIPTIIYSGRLDYDGGVDIFLEALKFINKKCNVIITGTGPRWDVVKKYNNSNKKVSFSYQGFLARVEYINLLTNSHIGVNPIRVQESFSKVSFPSKVLQYLEYGNLVISSNFIGLRNLRALQKYIYIYNSDSPEELGTVINKILKLRIDKKFIAKETQDYFAEEDERLQGFFGKFH